MATVKCYTTGCHNRIEPGSKYNNWNLWCTPCHADADPTTKMTKQQKQEYLQYKFAQRVFRDGRAGKLHHL